MTSKEVKVQFEELVLAGEIDNSLISICREINLHKDMATIFCCEGHPGKEHDAGSGYLGVMLKCAPNKRITDLYVLGNLWNIELEVMKNGNGWCCVDFEWRIIFRWDIDNASNALNNIRWFLDV